MKNPTANQVKALLKTAGVNTKFVRCSVDHNSIRVRLVSYEVDCEIVEKTLKQFEKIDRCEATGDILSGCNNFVFVSYDWQVQPTKKFVDAVNSLNFSFHAGCSRTMQEHHYAREVASLLGVSEGCAMSAVKNIIP